MTHSQTLRRRAVLLSQTIAFTLVIAPTLFAQNTAALGGAPSANSVGRWQAWLGCWAPMVNSAAGLVATTDAPNVCITPAPTAGDAAVTLTTIADGKVVDRTTLNANAQHQASEREGCKGFDMSEWAPTGQRLYFHSEHLCDGGVERHSTAILALNGAEWVDVRRVATSGTVGMIRAVHYRPLADTRSIPADILAQIPTDREMSVSAARMASQTPLTTADVIDAIHNVDAPVVEAWLVERGEPFKLDPKELVKLADAKVPARVIDVMVAVSYPKVFALDHSDFQGEKRTPSSAQPSNYGYAQPGPAMPYDPFYDYYGYNGYGYGGYGYGYNNYNPYSLGFNNGYGGFYYGTRPVIIYPRGTVPISTTGGTGTAQPTTNPKVVNGQGYTQGRTPTSSTPSSASSTSGSSGSSGASGSSGGSSSSGGGASSAGSGSTGRTAVPKCTGPKC